MIADLAAGTRQPMFGWANFARTVLVVADPSSKSILTARRLVRAGVGTYLVANKIQHPADLAAVEAGVPLPLLGWVPDDARLAAAEAQGRAPIDAAPDSPAVRAISDLTTRLLEVAA
jgi:CO dehydrogenase maturation factor